MLKKEVGTLIMVIMSGGDLFGGDTFETGVTVSINNVALQTAPLFQHLVLLEKKQKIYFLLVIYTSANPISWRQFLLVINDDWKHHKKNKFQRVVEWM